MTRISPWPPNQKSRVYLDSTGKQIPSNLTGKSLPAKTFVSEQHKLPIDRKKKLLGSTKLFINLPPAFFQAYLSIQMSDKPIKLPKINQNKNISVRECLSKHSAFAGSAGPLHPENWQNLGWASAEAYDKWLDSSMLFAFSHCNHYCSAIRVIDEQKVNDNSDTFYFIENTKKELEESPKRTNIYTVTGFEYRCFTESSSKTIESTLPEVLYHSALTMNQILLAAQATQTTDIVMIPFGMGVFIQGNKYEKQIKETMMQGIIAALKDYKGPPVKLHCCGWPDFFKQLESASNPLIQVLDKTGKDAYTVANYIQDIGDEQHGYEEGYDVNIAPRKLKSMLINAGDNDWTALLDQGKVPGQFSDGHTLYHSTSDEYFALVTNFAFYSVQNLIHLLKDLVATKKIEQLTNLENSLEPDLVNMNTTSSFFGQSAAKSINSNNPSLFSLEPKLINKINKTIETLEKEISSCWPYPNKDRKKLKSRGLQILLNNLNTMDPVSAVTAVEKQFTIIQDGKKICLLREGDWSTRTADLLDEVKESRASILGLTYK
jgi:hypothetical protein